MRRMLSAVCVVAAIAATTAPVLTVTNGQPDATGIRTSGWPFSRSESAGIRVRLLRRRTVADEFLTAAHCFDPSQPAFVWYKEGPPFGATFTPGTFTTHPDWCIGCGPGLPGSIFTMSR